MSFGVRTGAELFFRASEEIWGARNWGDGTEGEFEAQAESALASTMAATARLKMAHSLTPR
jgi:hypothetical protein